MVINHLLSGMILQVGYHFCWDNSLFVIILFCRDTVLLPRLKIFKVKQLWGTRISQEV